MLPRPIGRGCPPTVTEDRPIPGIWRYVTGALPRDDAIGTADLLQAQRLAALLRPALAATLLENYPGLLQGTQFDPENIRRAALKNRFKRGKALPWVRQILALGFDVVFLKGFATTHTIYTDPDLRRMTDVDILIRERDLARFVRALSASGFRFRRSRPKKWGSINDASFRPFSSPDKAIHVDIHIHPDDFPTHLGLTTEDVFEDARQIDVSGVRFSVPSLEHRVLVAIANVARDKFHRDCFNSLVDLVVLLTRTTAEPNWDEIRRRSDRAGIVKGVATVVTLLHRLGVPRARLPQDFIKEYRGMTAHVFESVVRDVGGLFPVAPSMLEMLGREVFLCASPSTAWRRSSQRIAGFLNPRSGLPDTQATT